MITGLYSAIGDSIPILCITGQAPTHLLHKEDFQAVDIATIAKPVTKMAVTVLEAAQVPGVFQQAFHLMRSGRPGPVLIDLPIDVQQTEIEFDPETYEPLPVYKPTATRAQIEKAIGFLLESERPLIVAGGGIINADASDLLVEFAEITNTPVVPTLMGWGTIPDNHDLNAGMVGQQTGHRYGNATFLESDFVLGIGNRWANRHTGYKLDVYTQGRTFVHVDIEPTQIGKIFAPDYGIASNTKAALELFVEVAKELKAAGRLPDRSAWVASHLKRKETLQRRTHRRRADEAAARVRGDEQGLRPRDAVRHHHRPLADRRHPDAARLQAAALDQLRSGGPARLDHPGRARRVEGRPGDPGRRPLR
ncbi:3D-(3,5/4)-trihydroxycyclohexane-1,2-dione hydrolase [Streptomyces alboniger]